MKNLFYAFSAGLMLAFSVTTQAQYTQYVKTTIGTAHCRWFHFAPASLPFGMAKAGPSTDGHLGSQDGWQANGYDCRHTSIEGFPNFHEFQVGGVVFAPSVGKLQTVPGELDNPDSGYRSRFDKKDEIARPGYYSVLLKDYGVKAEMTATERVVFHRYTYPKSDQSHLLIDIGHRQGESGQVLDASVQYYKDGRIEGYVVTRPSYVQAYQPDADVRMYFSAVVDHTPTSFGTFVDNKKYPGKRKQQGKGSGLYLTFKTTQNEAIQIKAGLSYTSIENARLNLTTEAETLQFDQAHSQANARWNAMLGRIEVEGGKADDFTKFYTGLYHALLGRGLASDVNGAYPKNDGSIGQIPLDADGKPLYHHYNTDAIWGGYWNLTQLWTLVYPEYFSDWIKSQLLVYKDAGWLGDGIACSKYVSGVGTNFVGLAIAAAYNCGIRDYDVEEAYEAAYKNEVEWVNRKPGAGKLDVKQFGRFGFVPYDSTLHMKTTPNGSGFAVSHTLEYAFSAYAVANMAKQLGYEEDYEQLMELAHGWKNVYDSETRLVRPKGLNGQFISDFDPTAPWKGFQEGNAIQYTFYVPQHIEELVDTIGREVFTHRLDSIFTLSQKNIFGGGTTLDAFSGLHTAYNHGNQPNLHISWLFNFSGRPDLTQKWVRAICNEFYGTDDVHGYGYGQDEDQGQLGAWYVMSAMGLFDVRGLTGNPPAFQIGSPLFDKITIHTSPKYYSGQDLVIRTSKDTPTSIYVNDVQWNGNPITNYTLPFEEAVSGGVLNLHLGKTFSPTLPPTKAKPQSKPQSKPKPRFRSNFRTR